MNYLFTSQKNKTIKLPKFDTYHIPFWKIIKIWKKDIDQLEHKDTIFDKIVRNEVTLPKEYENQSIVVIKPNRSSSWIKDSTKAKTSLEHFLVLPKTNKPIINAVTMKYSDLKYLAEINSFIWNYSSKYTLEYIKNWFEENDIDILLESTIVETLMNDSKFGGWDLCRESAEYIAKCILNDQEIEHEYIIGVHCYPYYSVGSLHIHVMNKAFITHAGKGILLKTTPIEEIYNYFH